MRALPDPMADARDCADWRCVAATPWLTRANASGPAGAEGARLAEFLRATWRLPSWAPQTSVRHALSPLLPARAGLVALLNALHGRLVVVNHAPVAAVPHADRALVRGLVEAALDGLPPPWPRMPRGASAGWPIDSRAAHGSVLAHEWLARYDALGAWRRVSAVAVGLYEGPWRIALSEGGGLGAEHAPEVRERVARRLPSRALGLPRVVATAEYRLVVVARDAADGAAARPLPGLDAQVSTALRTGVAIGASTPTAVWFSGSMLLPDAAVVAAMDARSRQRWAACTGRAGARDAYWFPESWARFLEPGRAVGCVSAASVARSVPGGREAAGAGHEFAPAAERGVCVPPGYALVDCVGTLQTAAVRNP